MRALLIDDEKIILKNLTKQLTDEKWNVDTSDNYKEASDKLLNSSYDIVICDHRLSNNPDDKKWLDLIKEARDYWNKSPVILLTWRGVDEISPWEALNAWFDDFIKKPYEFKELMSRIMAIIRRQFPSETIKNTLIHWDISIELDTRKVEVWWINIKLWNTLFLILIKLLKERWKIITQERLIEYIWWDSALYHNQSSTTLRVHMTYLKKAMWKKFSDKVKTIHWVGYLFDEEE